MENSIYGKSICLKQLKIADENKDVKKIENWINDPDVTRLMFYGRTPQTREQIKELFEGYINSDENIIFMIVDTATGLTIGFCGLFDIDPTARKAELRIAIGEKDFRGLNFGMEVIALITHYGFDKLGLNMLHLGTTREDNRGSIRFFELLGYKLGGIRRSILYRNGRYYDGTMMDILRSEYYTEVFEFYKEQFDINNIEQR